MHHPGVNPGSDGPKKVVFWVKNWPKREDAIMRKISPGNCIMGQNTPQEMGLDVLGIFMHHPGINPGPG